MSEQTPQELEVRAAPLSKVDESLLTHFAQDVAQQATRLDDIAKQLITLNLAIPGIYAAILKFISGDKATLTDPTTLYITFGLWLFALGCTLFSLFPKRNEIDPDDLNAIYNYFSQSAQRKLTMITLASISSFAGICFAVSSIII